MTGRMKEILHSLIEIADMMKNIGNDFFVNYLPNIDGIEVQLYMGGWERDIESGETASLYDFDVDCNTKMYRMFQKFVDEKMTVDDVVLLMNTIGSRENCGDSLEEMEAEMPF
jgi:hypothetical protein